MIETNAHDDYSMHLMTRILGLGTVGHLERPPIHKYTMLNGSRLYFADIGRAIAEGDVSHKWKDWHMMCDTSRMREFKLDIEIDVEVKVMEPAAFLLVTDKGEILWGKECIKAALIQIILDEAREQVQGTCDDIKVELKRRPLLDLKDIDLGGGNAPHPPYEPTFLSPWREE